MADEAAGRAPASPPRSIVSWPAATGRAGAMKAAAAGAALLAVTGLALVAVPLFQHASAAATPAIVASPQAVSGLPAVVDGQPLPSLAPILERVTPGVVNVSTMAEPQQANPLRDDPFYRRFFEQQRRAEPSRPSALGSGVIVDAKQGLVLTNDHVVAGAGRVLITLADGRELEAERVGTDPDADIAVVRIEADGLTQVEWADSDATRVGDFCIAIGNPFGLGQTVTSGIVSALGRSGLGIEEFEDFIQTDASINPGNSGGALVGLDGRLLGINTAIVGPAGGNVGIGFAIPANLARSLLEELVEHGEVRRGALGISAQALTPELSRALDAGTDTGVVIADVREGSPAADAGLAPGDVVTAIDGRAVRDVDDVRNRIGLVRIGQQLSLSVVRDGRTKELQATVAALQSFNPLLDGARFSDVRTRNGSDVVVIDRLEPDSRLGRAGLARGDVILSVGDTTVESVDQLETVADRYPDELVLGVQRGRLRQQVRIGG